MLRTTIKSKFTRRFVGSRPPSAPAVSDHDQSPLARSGLFIVAIPITLKRSYLYCNHQPGKLSIAQLSKVPWILRLDNKISNLAAKGWRKLQDSPNYINVRITKLVYKLLSSIPYEELCVALFPSHRAMIREYDHAKPNLTQSQQVEQQPTNNYNLETIPLLYPTSQLVIHVKEQIHRLCSLESHHYKYMIICGFLLPFTLPLALLPVVPNVPGIYLAYRFYCHIKALLGIKHLKRLAGNSKETHLEYVASDEMQLAIGTVCDSQETLLLSSEIIDNLCFRLNLPHIKNDLLKAMRQEQQRLCAFESSPEMNDSSNQGTNPTFDRDT